MVMTCLLFSLMLLMKQVASLAESENYSWIIENCRQ
jgi:hypothetical protein